MIFLQNTKMDIVKLVIVGGGLLGTLCHDFHIFVLESLKLSPSQDKSESDFKGELEGNHCIQDNF